MVLKNIEQDGSTSHGGTKSPQEADFGREAADGQAETYRTAFSMETEK